LQAETAFSGDLAKGALVVPVVVGVVDCGGDPVFGAGCWAKAVLAAIAMAAAVTIRLFAKSRGVLLK
jgi:hypothetical protein